MRTIAIIPARGASKGIPGKNLERVGGRSLLARAIHVTMLARTVDATFVTTDDDAIAAEARAAGATVIWRPATLATDAASSEVALLHALEEIGADPEVVVFVQCTSPFIDPSDIDTAVRLVSAGDCDCAFSAADFHRFVWRPGPDGGFAGVNHDATIRLRRQDRPTEVCETGAFYVFRRREFVARGHRFFGRILPVVVHTDPMEVDEFDDLVRARLLAGAPDLVLGHDVCAVVTDFDGVHTDNRARIDEQGTESVVVHRGDGLGVAQLVAAGVPFLILSTERNPVVQRRADKLGVECISGCADKAPALGQWLERNQLAADRTVFVGNDHNDVECLRSVGLPVVVADAHPSVLPLARFVTRASGGHGAVREVADAVLAARVANERDRQHHQEVIHVRT